MKIYQIHKSSGEWEDGYNIIVGSYLKFNKAKEEKRKTPNRRTYAYFESTEMR